MAVYNAYAHFDPTSLIAGDLELPSRKVALPSGLNSAGSPLLPGTLLGMKTVAPTYVGVAAAKAGITGGGTCTMGSPTTLANVMAGVYRVVFSSATAYQVYDPRGDEIGTGVNGTPFATQVKFTTAASGAAFISGDEFDITVTQTAGALFSVASAAGGSNTGNGTLTLATPSFVPGVFAGVYTLQMQSPTTFEVFDPYGNPVGSGATGTAFSNQVAFTLAAGGTAFVGGDSFTITVSAQALFIPCVMTATDGSQNPIAVLAEEVDTSGGAALAEAYFGGDFAYELMTIDASWPSLDAINVALTIYSGNIYVRRVGATA